MKISENKHQTKTYYMSIDNNGWISVDDSMPYDGQKVIFYSEEEGVIMGSYDMRNGFQDYELLYDGITHWQPIPPPPIKQTV